MWTLKLEACVNFLPHMLHSNGFSPVWILRWVFKLPGCVKHFPHWLHWKHIQKLTGLIAHLNLRTHLERFVTDMRFDMLHEQTTLLKLLGAQRALIKHRLPMRHHVFFQQIIVTKLFTTTVDGTGDRCRASVRLCVQRKAGCIQEAFIALKTLERFIGKMRFHMHHQRVRLCEAFVALVALKRKDEISFRLKWIGFVNSLCMDVLLNGFYETKTKLKHLSRNFQNKLFSPQVRV